MSAIKKLSDAEISQRLASLPGWSLDGGKLFRELRFADFIDAFAFMTRVALIAQQADHHPEWSNVYNTVRVHLSTHDAGGISAKDFELAAAMNARLA